MNWFLVIVFVLEGFMFIGLSIPLILRKIPPNMMYGYRTRKTRENPDTWYKANEYAGKRLAVAGGVISLASVLLGMLKLPDNTFAISMVLVMTVSCGAAAVISLVYVEKL